MSQSLPLRPPVTLLLAVVFFSTFHAADFALAKDQKDFRSIQLAGECLRKVERDRGSVTLTAEFVDLSSKSASQQATKQYNEFTARVKKLNLKDAELNTTNMQVMEEYVYPVKPNRIRKYKAHAGLKVQTSELERLGEVLKVGTDMGVQNISGLEFFVSPAKMKETYEACLQEAFKNARSKAEKLGEAGNFKIGSVLEVSENQVGVSPLFMRSGMAAGGMAMRSDAAPAQIETSAQDVQVQVNVMFEIK